MTRKLTPKLTPIMTEAITSAYRRVVEGYRPAVHGDHYVIHGLKTNTAKALISRGLIRAARVGAFTEYVLRADGIALADTLTRDAAWRVRIEEQATRVEQAEIARREHFANATSEDIARADGDGPIYRASHAALLSAIAAAYPDVQAADVYDVWADCNESIAYCARRVRENGPLSAQYSATEDTEDTETDWVDALQADPSASTRNPHWACDTPGATGCPTGEHADRAPLETVVDTIDVAATIDRLTPAQRVTLYRSAVDDGGTLVRGADGYGTQAVWGGAVATTVALRNVGLVELRRDVTSTRNYRRNVVTPVGFMIAAEMIRRGWTLATLQAAVTDARKATPIQQTITAHRDLIIRVHGAVTGVTSNTHVTPSTPIGTVCVVASRGAWRRGVLVAVGRTNATVAYTTVAAMRDNPADPLITIKADRMERVEVVHGPDGGDENMISPADLVPGDVADADTDAIDRAEHDAVAAMIEAERAEEGAFATEDDHHGRHAPHMAVKPRGISPLSARERDARKARRRAQKQARKIARRAGR